MHFLPEKAEIIASALRNSIGRRAFKSKSFLGSALLRRLKYFELCRRRDFICATDICVFFNAVSYSSLISSALKGYIFYPTVRGNGVYCIDREKISALFSEICMSAAVHGGNIEMGTKGDFLYIKWNGGELSKENIPLIRSVKAVYLKLKKKNKYILFIKSEAALYPEKLYSGVINRAAETAAMQLDKRNDQ